VSVYLFYPLLKCYQVGNINLVLMPANNWLPTFIPNFRNKMIKFQGLVILLILISINQSFSQKKVLFDCTKAETANNADWVIDADLFNLGDGTGGIMQVGRGNEANPAKLPTPSWTTITATTPETYWKGAISSWGIGVAKLGYEPQTLPYNGKITYGDNTNPQDLKNYKVYIVMEPNIKFTAAEKTAILAFVAAGGGLLAIADHAGSDRNNDGVDSPTVWNDLFNNNTVAVNPFGFTFDMVTFSQVCSNAANLPTDSLLHGPKGNPTQIQINGGTTMTLSPASNPNVKGIMYRPTGPPTGNFDVLVATSRYGNGRVVGLSDSSPPDDGTGDPNDQLYSSWLTSVNGDHEKLLLNATLWLLGPKVTTAATEQLAQTNLHIGNTENGFTVLSPEAGHLSLTDMLGRVVWQAEISQGFTDIPVSEGMYLVRFSGHVTQVVKRVIR
jgi:hypothetical protein